MTDQNTEARLNLINKLGYDPLDFSWLETELAQNDLERKWFKFQRENNGGFDDQWNKNTIIFNQQYHENITSEKAYVLCLKWKRYLIGAWATLSSQNPNKKDWIIAAKKFEKRHVLRQERMEKWSEEHKNNFPLVKVIKPIRFRHGPYFFECLKSIPKMFVNYLCYQIRKEVILQVISYDPEIRFIQLDFTPDIRKKIKPVEENYEPWKRMKSNYDFDVYPEEIDDHLEFLNPID